MSDICYMLGTHGASGPRGPDLAHMHLMYRLYTTLITPCNGRYEVPTHATYRVLLG